MQVRGAPLIGAAAAYGIALALQEDAGDEHLTAAARALAATRPTAVNLRWALERMINALQPLPCQQRSQQAFLLADQLCEEDIATNSRIGDYGLKALRGLAEHKTLAGKKGALNILTHCNAGALATVDWGTALAPVYKAASAGLDIHVWVDETRPRNQGASLTAWELTQRGVAHTLISDNSGGHLMQQGLVDLCLVGSDRTTASGDVCNKIGTYLKALAAFDNQIPFYACLPTSTIDWQLHDGVSDIPIEQRSGEELSHIEGIDERGQRVRIRIAPVGSPIANHAFDVTPARLVTGLITEYGLFKANADDLQRLQETLKNE